MNDKELLEYAAKAAGIELWMAADAPFVWAEVAGAKVPMHWNPLKDDGDALRLSVKLHIDVLTPDEDHAQAGTIMPEGSNGPWQDSLGDDATTTRMAIVRAAAEIGKAMP